VDVALRFGWYYDAPVYVGKLLGVKLSHREAHEHMSAWTRSTLLNFEDCFGGTVHFYRQQDGRVRADFDNGHGLSLCATETTLDGAFGWLTRYLSAHL
jgi:hypothetical protein